MSHFEARKAEIADQLWEASTEIGFFQLVNHGIPQEQIDEAFDMTARFFALPHDTKAQVSAAQGHQCRLGIQGQVRPSTGTADNKESYQITLPRMASLWPTGDELPGFKADHARLRARELGARHEGAVVLCAEARFCAGFLHRLPRPAVAGISEHAAAAALSADGSTPSPRTSPAGAPARTPTSIA